MIDVVIEYATRLHRCAPGTGYAFATGRVRALEDRLLSYSNLENLLHVDQTLDDVDDVLSEARYPEGETIDLRLKKGVAEASALLKELTQNGLLARALLLEEDFHNLKLFLKYLRGGAVGEKTDFSAGMAALMPEGEAGEIPDSLRDLLFMEAMVSPDELWHGLQSLGSGAGAPGGDAGELVAVAAEEMTHWGTDARMAEIDIRLDRKRFERLGELAASVKGDKALACYLACYRELTADLTNLQTALRLLRLGASAAALDESLVSGGRAVPEQIVGNFSDGIEGLKFAFSRSAADHLLPMLDEYANAGQIYPFGREQNETLMAFARLGTLSGSGPAQIGGYWLARRVEAQNLRIIVAAKESGIPVEFAETLLRDTYLEGRV